MVFWIYGQILMDNHKFIMILFLYCFPKHDKKKLYKKYKWKKFKFWPYAYKEKHIFMASVGQREGDFVLG